MESQSENLGPKANSTNCDEDDNFALHKLDDCCVLKIYSYLLPDDARNLGKTSKRMKNLWMFRFHKLTFEFHSDMLSKTTERGRKVLDVILLEYGEHIRSWSLTILNMYMNDVAELIRRVSQCCTNLKRLEIRGISDMSVAFNCSEAVKCFANVEILRFFYCRQMYPAVFLQYFRNLKELHFDECGTTGRNMQILFQNNPKIETFYYNGYDTFSEGKSLRDETFSNDLCEFKPNVHKLYLGKFTEHKYQQTDHLQMDKILRLATIATNLTKFKLESIGVRNWKIFLTELGKNGNLKELELEKIEIGRDGLKIIAESFQNLELLTFCPNGFGSHECQFDSEDEYYMQWDPSRITLPKKWSINLIKLKTSIPMTAIDFEWIMEELKSLTHLQISNWRDVGQARQDQILRKSLTMQHSQPFLELLVFRRLTHVDYKHRRIRDGYYSDSDAEKFIKIDFSMPTQRLTKAFAY